MTGHLKKFADGEVIFRPGDTPDCMYFIRGGGVTVSCVEDSIEILLASLKAGDFFGEMSLLDGKPRSATVKAPGDVVVESVSREQLAEQVRDPAAWGMLAKLAGRMRAVDDSLERLIVEDASRRDAMSAIAIRRNLY